jgi:hypothetical protein
VLILSVEIFSATSTVAYAMLLTKSSKSKKSDGLLPVRLGLQKNGREPNRFRWAPACTACAACTAAWQLQLARMAYAVHSLMAAPVP